MKWLGPIWWQSCSHFNNQIFEYLFLKNFYDFFFQILNESITHNHTIRYFTDFKHTYFESKNRNWIGDSTVDYDLFLFPIKPFPFGFSKFYKTRWGRLNFLNKNHTEQIRTIHNVTAKRYRVFIYIILDRSKSRRKQNYTQTGLCFVTTSTREHNTRWFWRVLHK